MAQNQSVVLDGDNVLSAIPSNITIGAMPETVKRVVLMTQCQIVPPFDVAQMAQYQSVLRRMAMICLAQCQTF